MVNLIPWIFSFYSQTKIKLGQPENVASTGLAGPAASGKLCL